MRFSFVSYHVPDAEGTAAGRILLATVEGLLEDGHDVDAWSWRAEPPRAPLPAWCDWEPLPTESRAANRLWSVIRPRDEAARTHRRLLEDPDTVAVADDPASFPAVRHSPRATVTMHYLRRLDDRALGRASASSLQVRRAERRYVRQAALVLCYSHRLVADLARGRYVPCAYRAAAEGVPPTDEPVAALVANWAWEPNRQAARRLLQIWPEVRAQLPSARLVLAGRGSDHLSVGTLAGVEVRGEVTRSADVLADAAVVAFPCPQTSGPKVKVLEALGLGIPVVTTAAGVEGLVPAAIDGCVVTDGPRFADAVISLFKDPQRRSRLGAAGRAGVISGHGPLPVARRRVAVIRQAFDAAGC